MQKTVNLYPSVGLPGQEVAAHTAVYTPLNYLSDGTAAAGKFVFEGTSDKKGVAFPSPPPRVRPSSVSSNAPSPPPSRAASTAPKPTRTVLNSRSPCAVTSTLKPLARLRSVRPSFAIPLMALCLTALSAAKTTPAGSSSRPRRLRATSSSSPADKRRLNNGHESRIS